jgi:hypothetical protein
MQGRKGNYQILHSSAVKSIYNDNVITHYNVTLLKSCGMGGVFACK